VTPVNIEQINSNFIFETLSPRGTNSRGKSLKETKNVAHVLNYHL